MLHVSLPGCRVDDSTTVSLPSAGRHRASIKVDIGSDVERWWPLGYGQPHLHDLKVTFTPGHATSSGGATGAASSVHKQVGFKQVELVREPLTDGHDGETFFFRARISYPAMCSAAARHLSRSAPS